MQESGLLQPTIRWRSLLILSLVMMGGCAIRVVYHWEHMKAPDYASPVLDPQLNDYWARALLSGNWTPPPHADNPCIPSTPYGRPPAYPWLLAGLYWLSKGSYHFPRIVQFLVGLATIPLVYLIGRRVFNTKVGLVSSLLMALYWGGPYFEGELNSPVWEIFLSLLMTHTILRYLETPKGRYLALSGLMLGAGILLRPNVTLVCIFISAFLFIFEFVRRRRFWGTIGCVLLFFGSCLAPVVPVVMRNWWISGEFVFVSYYGGINAYIGNNPKSDGVSAEVPDLYELSGVEKWNCFNYPSIVKGMGLRLGQKEMGFSDASRYFYRHAVKYWLEQPGHALLLTIRKAWFFWGPHEISDSKVVHFERLHSVVLVWLPRFSLIAALAFSGIWFASLKSPPLNIPALFLMTYIVAYFFSILPFFISERYRFPVVPFLIPFSAFSIAYTWTSIRDQSLTVFFKKCIIIIVVYVAITVPVFPYSPNLSTWHLHRGISFVAGGETDQAIEALNKSVAVDPSNDEAYLQLGFLKASLGYHEQAVTCYQRSVISNPHNLFALNNLGYELFLQGHYSEAEAYFRQALQRQPVYTLAWNNLGNTLSKSGRLSEALAAFQKALEINPDDPFARYNMGNALMDGGRYWEAVDILTKAFECQPYNPNIANNLGLAMARSGRLEESIPWFEKALELTQEYPLAHFNLGNVYGDLGKLQEARFHFKKCLEYWPDHEESRKQLRLLNEDKN